MTTRREAARRVQEEIANVGAPPQDNQVPPQGNNAPPQEQVPLDGQASINPPAMTDGEIRSAFLSLAQFMTTQAQAITT